MHFSKPILAIESSCDETAVAILQPPSRLLVSLVASQVKQHVPFGGVVPEVASRQHLSDIDPLFHQALEEGKLLPSDFGAIVATSGPGLAPALLVGASYAKGVALGLGVPYLGVNHLEGHFLSPFFGEEKIPRHLSLLVSGGHTQLTEINGAGHYHCLGRTQDDAVGEAFDKVAKLLGLPYPGGIEIDRLANQGDPKRYFFPRALMEKGNLNFSFSGLKTAVRYFLEKKTNAPKTLGIEPVQQGIQNKEQGAQNRSDEALHRSSGMVEGFLEQQELCDICASFQEAVIAVLLEKICRAAEQHDLGCIALSGGVAANSALRRELKKLCNERGWRLCLAPLELAGDNAAMIAFAGWHRLLLGERGSVAEEIRPQWQIAAD